MRKTLLFTLALGAFIQTNASNPYNGVKKVEKFKRNLNHLDGAQLSIPNYNLAPNQTPNEFVAAAAPVSRVNAGSCPNLYYAIYGGANTVYANQDLGLITVTKRRNEGDPGEVGYVQTSFSTDGGQSFDSTLAVVSDDIHLCRYPSGAIYNPPGNTNPLNAFIVASGPWHPGADWQGNYFASTRINGTDNNVTIQDNTTTSNQKFDFARTNIQSCTNGKVYVTSAEYTNVNGTTAAEQGWIKGVLNIGNFLPSSNTFDWTTRAFPHNMRPDLTDGTPRVFSSPYSAWSEDGQVGYFIYIGEDATTYFDYYLPIVYKTLDAGATWTQMPIYDFRNLPALMSKIRSTRQGTKRPFFTQSQGFDAVVDKDNNLHIFTMVGSASTDDPDSLDFTWTFPQHLFDITSTPCGNWNAISIDSLKTDAVADANSFWTDQNGIGWDARLNCGRTTDGSKIFYSWIDSDPAVWGSITENLFPDILGKGLDVQTKNLTPTINYTADDLVNAGKNFWYFSSNIVLQNDTTYSIPSTVADSRIAGDDGSGTISVYYVNGLKMTESQFNIPAYTCPAVTANVTTVNDVCATGVGSATLNIANPSNYCYLWDNVQTNSNTQGNYSSGSHSVTIYDASGCSNSFDFTIGGDLGVSSVSSSFTQSTACLSPDGSATVTIQPNPTSYSWNTNPVQTDSTATNLAAGTYVCTVITSTGCSVPYTVVVTPANGANANLSSAPAKCNGTASGTAFSAPTGGTSPYTFVWNTVPPQLNDTATALAPGDYVVTVTDSEGCSTTDTVTVADAPAITLASSTIVGQSSNSNPDGSITVNIAGGAGSFSYSWNTTPVQTTNTASNLGAGSYSVTVTDANSCTQSFSLTVPNYTGIKESSNSNLVSVFPNPTKGLLNIKFEGIKSNSVSIKVFNTSGQMVYSSINKTNANGSISSIDFEPYANGIYFVQISSDKEVITKRVIKSNN